MYVEFSEFCILKVSEGN